MTCISCYSGGSRRVDRSRVGCGAYMGATSPLLVIAAVGGANMTRWLNGRGVRALCPVFAMLLGTSVLACNRPPAAPVAPAVPAAISSVAPLPSTGERTYRIVPQQTTASYQAQEKWLR